MIGKNIRKLRIEKGITQSSLSNYLGLTPKMISFYELGERFPPHDIIIKLADYFDVSTDYLLGRSGIKNPEKMLTDYSLLNESPQVYIKTDALTSSIGKRIHDKRAESNMSAENLADALGISEKELGEYERGIHPPSARILIALSHVFHVSADWLLTGKEYGQNSK